MRLTIPALLLFSFFLREAVFASPVEDGPECYIIADDPLADALEDTGALISYDPSTGAETAITVTGAQNIEAIAYDPFRGVLYAIDQARFGTIDTQTGAFVARADSLGSGNGALGMLTFMDVDGLAVDPFSGRLFASVKREDEDDLLIQIDPSRGKFVAGAFGPGIDYVRIEPAGDQGDIDDLTFDSESGRLYGVANDRGYDDRLVVIDVKTGNIDDIGGLERDNGKAVEDMEGITFTASGQMLGVMGAGAKRIYLIDKETATANRIAILTLAGDYESIECFMPDDYVRIEGDVFSDRNADTLYGEDEAGVWGVPVHLYRDTNGNGRADGRDHLLAVTETETEGAYGFRFAAVGPHVVTIDASALPDGVSVTTGSSRLVEVTSFGKRYRHQDFGISNLPEVRTVSSGADAGVESEGSMATLLGQRQFVRRQDSHLRQALKAAPSPVPFGGGPVFTGAGKTAFADVQMLIPENGPASSAAFVVSPADLIGVTNAFSVFAADYMRPDGNRVAALFAATSPMNQPYSNSKVICDRLAGATLEDVRYIAINNATFILSRVTHRDGSTDYAVSFIAYRNGNDVVVDSRFTSSEYRFDGLTSEILNVQVWSISPRYTADVVKSILDNLAAGGRLTYLNAGNTRPELPEVYVRDGAYNHGILTLRVFNRTGSQTVNIKGTLARTEIEAGRKQRVPFERRISLSGTPGTTAYVELSVGAIYDADLALETATGGDRIYHADGVWSFARGETSSISFFETYADPFAGTSVGDFVVERDAYMSGSLGDWAALFRYMHPGGEGVDLTEFGYIEFKAYGTGTIRLVLEKESITNWDQYGYTFKLKPTEEIVRIPLREFTRADGSAGFTAEDVALLAFYVEKTGYGTQRFELSVRDVSFGGPWNVSNEDAEPVHTFALQPNYPNPFNPSTQIGFSLPETQHVVLAVYDLLGRRVATLTDGLLSAGSHAVTFNAADLASGTYVYRLNAGDEVVSRTMMLLK